MSEKSDFKTISASLYALGVKHDLRPVGMTFCRNMPTNTYYVIDFAGARLCFDRTENYLGALNETGEFEPKE